jgi:hypothetical protein
MFRARRAAQGRKSPGGPALIITWDFIANLLGQRGFASVNAGQQDVSAAKGDTFTPIAHLDLAGTFAGTLATAAAAGAGGGWAHREQDRGGDGG